jgi:type IV secretory pathway VirB6-like protein
VLPQKKGDIETPSPLDKGDSKVSKAFFPATKIRPKRQEKKKKQSKSEKYHYIGDLLLVSHLGSREFSFLAYCIVLSLIYIYIYIYMYVTNVYVYEFIHTYIYIYIYMYEY